MDDQFAIFEEKVEVSPFDLHGEITDFNELLVKKLRKRLEGKCSQHGYVIPDSVELLSRSLGTMEKGRFTADFLYYCKAQGRVLNPSDGTLLTVKVDIKNNAGIYGIVENAIEVIVARDIHIGDEEFHDLQLGDIIQVRVLKSRFQINDQHITSVCEYVGKGTAGAGVAAAAAPPVASVVVLGEEEEVEESSESKEADEEEESGESKEADEEEESGEEAGPAVEEGEAAEEEEQEELNVSSAESV